MTIYCVCNINSKGKYTVNNVKRVREILNNKSLDSILISNEDNIRYISGFTGGTGYLYISQNRQALITDFRYTIHAENEAKGWEVLTIDGDGYNKVINALLKEEQVLQLGFESFDLLYGDYLNFKEGLELGNFIPVKDEITGLRTIKTAEELEYIKMAQSVADKTFSDILEFIKPGKTEIEIAARIEYLLKINGAHGISFDTIVASGINSSMPHAVPSMKKVEDGDFITMDFGCKYNGYCSDMTRTIVVGKANAKQIEVYNTVLRSQEAALNIIKSGLKGKDIDKVARDIIYNAGYEGCFGHGLGHSLGLFIHENPRLSPAEEGLILENMVITVEPGIYIKDFGGVRIEDLVVVTENSCENLTRSSKELIEL